MDNNALSRPFTGASLLRFALPNIIMMVFLSLYTIVDGIFISRFVGTLALSAVNMSYPINSVELAIGIMLGTGGSAVIARRMGEGKTARAREDFTCITAVSLGIGVVFALMGNVCLDPLLRLLGTSPAQFALCRSYTRVLLWFAPALFLQTAFQVLFVTAGKPVLGLWVTVAGGVANMLLDWLLMGPVGMGVTGAAVATGIGYCIPAAAGVWFFSRKRDVPLYFTAFRPDRKMLLQACWNGSSEMVSNVANAVTTFLFNLIFLAYWQEDGVAAITIVMYVQFVFTAVFFGFSMGVAPVISYQYGAQNTEQLRRICRFCISFTLLCSLAMYLLSRALIGPCLAVFTDAESRVYAITMEGFPLYALCFLLMGISIFASALFTALSNGTVSAAISFARTLVFLVGTLLLMPRLWGQWGIWLAVPAAELLGVLVSVGFLFWGKRKYRY